MKIGIQVVVDMGCCDKAKSVLKKGKHIAISYSNLARGKKYEFTDGRVRICQKCDKSYWQGRSIFCVMFLRRFGQTLWPDPFAFVPAKARIKDEKCPIGKW